MRDANRDMEVHRYGDSAVKEKGRILSDNRTTILLVV